MAVIFLPLVATANFRAGQVISLRDYGQFHHIWGGFKNHRPKSALTYLIFSKHQALSAPF